MSQENSKPRPNSITPYQTLPPAPLRSVVTEAIFLLPHPQMLAGFEKPIAKHKKPYPPPAAGNGHKDRDAK